MIDFDLYLVTDRKRSGGSSILNVIHSALRAGVKAVQLREKDMATGELLALARDLRRMTRDYGASLFINDRVDIALSVNSDGVHLGQESIPVEDARGLLGKERLIGVSTHSIDEAGEAERKGADFITLGPVFYTPSKSVYGKPIGVKTIRAVKAEIGIPVFAIGGIRKEYVKDVVTAGADGVAVISAIINQANPSLEAKKILTELKKYKRDGNNTEESV